MNLLNDSQKIALLTNYMHFMNAKFYEPIKWEVFEYAHKRIDLFAEAENISFLAEFMSDMEEYEGYTWLDHQMPMFSNVGFALVCNRLDAEKIVYDLWGYDAVNEVTSYRERTNIGLGKCIGAPGFLEIIFKFTKGVQQ